MKLYCCSTAARVLRQGTMCCCAMLALLLTSGTALRPTNSQRVPAHIGNMHLRAVHCDGNGSKNFNILPQTYPVLVGQWFKDAEVASQDPSGR